MGFLILIVLFIVSLFLMYLGLYLCYKDNSEEELKYYKKYFSSYNKCEDIK